jgi:hypothetical protein
MTLIGDVLTPFFAENAPSEGCGNLPISQDWQAYRHCNGGLSGEFLSST